jgi:hypothetical protein
VVKLVDTLDLGSSALTGVGVRVPSLVLFTLITPIFTVYWGFYFCNVSQMFPNGYITITK